MKKIFISGVLLFLFSAQTNAQDSMRVRSMTFKAQIKGQVSRGGYLSAFSDSVFYLSSKPVAFRPYSQINYSDAGIHYQNVREAFIKRKGNAGRGFLKGLVAGAVLGAIGGFADGSDPECSNIGSAYGFSLCGPSYTASQKAAFGSVAFGFMGGIIGVLTGALTGRNFAISGDQEKFRALRNHMIKKSVRIKGK